MVSFDFGIGDVFEAGAGLLGARETNEANLKMAAEQRKLIRETEEGRKRLATGTGLDTATNLNLTGGLDTTAVGPNKERYRGDFTRAIAANQLIDKPTGLGRIDADAIAFDEGRARDLQLGKLRDSAILQAMRAGAGTNSGVASAFADKAGDFAITNQGINPRLRSEEIQASTAKAGLANKLQELALLSPQATGAGGNANMIAAQAAVSAGVPQAAPDYGTALPLEQVKLSFAGINDRLAQTDADAAFRRAWLDLNERTQGDQLPKNRMPLPYNIPSIRTS